MTLEETLTATSAEWLVDAIIRLTVRIHRYNLGDPNASQKAAELRRQRDVVKAELVGRTLAPVSAEADR